MITKYVLPVVAAALLVFAVVSVLPGRHETPPAGPPVMPPRSPYADTVAGAGLIEASTENINVGAPAAGIVVELFVEVGQQVKSGDPLFRLDDSVLLAELKVGEANLAAARADLQRLQALPRPEDVPISEAAVQQEEANVAEKEDKYRRLEKLLPRKVVTEEEVRAAEFQLRIAQAQLAHARAELALLKAGAWVHEIDQAQAAVARAEAARDQTRTELDLLTVRARIDAEVLQVNVRPGEYVTTFGAQSLIVLGNTHVLHVRVDIDENDIPRFRQGAAAVAMQRGDATRAFPLKFVRVEPFVIPKRSLTGENTERVDTRVLQVIYSIDCEGETLYVGQLLDVFIDASGTASAGRPAPAPKKTRPGTPVPGRAALDQGRPGVAKALPEKGSDPFPGKTALLAEGPTPFPTKPRPGPPGAPRTAPGSRGSACGRRPRCR